MYEQKKLISQIKPVIEFYKQPGVVGVVLYGGWARGDQTDYSDVDIGVVCENSEILQKLSKKYDNNWQCKNHIVEITYYDYDFLCNQQLPNRYSDIKNTYWSENNRFNWQQSIILFDSNNKLQSLINQKAILPKAEQKANLNALNWEINRRLNYILPRFIEAKRYLEAQIVMNNTILVIIHYLVDQEGLLMPYDKAALFWFNKSKILGKEYVSELFNYSQANAVDCMKRVTNIRQVCKKLKININNQTIEEFMQSFFAPLDIK
jgi:predicted nucleotidyltransferase